MSDFFENYKRPEWQKKRLEIMNRDGWRCTDCGEEDKTLNVHHTYYEKGLMPWEYPDESLHTLCEGCHKKAQEQMKVLHREIGLTSLSDLDRVIGYLRVLRVESHYDFALVTSYEVAMGIGDVWGLTADEVIHAMDLMGRISGEMLHALKVAKMRTQPTEQPESLLPF